MVSKSTLIANCCIVEGIYAVTNSLSIVSIQPLTFRHHASYIYDRRTANPQSKFFIYLVNKYI